MDTNSDYVNPRKVRMELDYAKNIFKRFGFPSINITNKPIEYSANEIVTQLTHHFGSDKWHREHLH